MSTITLTLTCRRCTAVLPLVASLAHISPLCRLIRETRESQMVDIIPPRVVTRELVDRPVCTTDEAAAILAAFEHRLEAIAAYCEMIGTLPVFIIPPSNDAGFDPSRSVLAPETSRDERVAFAHQVARRALESRNRDRAVRIDRELLRAPSRIRRDALPPGPAAGADRLLGGGAAALYRSPRARRHAVALSRAVSPGVPRGGGATSPLATGRWAQGARSQEPARDRGRPLLPRRAAPQPTGLRRPGPGRTQPDEGSPRLRLARNSAGPGRRPGACASTSSSIEPGGRRSARADRSSFDPRRTFAMTRGFATSNLRPTTRAAAAMRAGVDPAEAGIPGWPLPPSRRRRGSFREWSVVSSQRSVVRRRNRKPPIELLCRLQIRRCLRDD